MAYIDARDIYLEEIMDWSDLYTETLANKSDSLEARTAMNSIVQLWLSSCAMEINLRQYKKAFTVYDKALEDPVVNRCSDIYLAYVEYCQTRGKLPQAQNVFIKGLKAGLLQTEADKLWAKFLSFIQAQQNSPDLTVEQLYDAVRKEAGIDTLTPPGSIAASMTQIKQESVMDVVSATTAAVEDASGGLQVPASVSEIEYSNGRSDHMVVAAETKDDDIAPSSLLSNPTITASSTAAGSGNGSSSSGASRPPPAPTGDDLDTVAGITPEVLCRMYRVRPPILFSAPNREPTLRGLALLRPEEISELEAFLGDKLMNVQYAEKRGPADRYLDLVEAMWTAQSLKERHFDYWFTEMRKLHDAEEAELRGRLAEREKKTGGSHETKAKNQAEWQRLQDRRSVQHEVLSAVVNKTMLSMLLEQQRVFLAAGFPRFTPGVISTLEHAANAVRSLGSGIGALGCVTDFDPALVQELGRQRMYTCAMLSLRVNYRALRAGSGSGSGSGGGGGNGSGSGGGSGGGNGSGSRSAGSGGGGGGGGGGGEMRGAEYEDYYSAESKLMRKAKRRRMSEPDSPPSVRHTQGYSSRSGQGQGRSQGQGQGQGPSTRGYGSGSSGGGLSLPDPPRAMTRKHGHGHGHGPAAVVPIRPTQGGSAELLQKLVNLSSLVQNVKK